MRAPVRDWYLIHGIRVAVRAYDARLREAARALLGPFRELTGGSHVATRHHTRGANLHVHLVRGTAPACVPADARTWLSFEELRCLTDGQASYVELDGRYLARLAHETGRIDAWIPPDLVADPWLVGHAILQPLLVEALAARGLYALHAAALSRDGRVAIFPAESGSGKTTLSLALVRGGFRLLSDDAPFLRRVGGGIEVCAFADRVNVTAQTCAFFPELRAHWEAGTPNPHRGKVPIDIAAVYDDSVTSSGTPYAVIFPSHSKREETIIEPLGKTEALLRLLPSMLAGSTREMRQARFSLASDLIGQLPCYQMDTGMDFAAIPHIVERLFAGEPVRAERKISHG
jgi:hypothetical protein